MPFGIVDFWKSKSNIRYEDPICPKFKDLDMIFFNDKKLSII